MMVGQRVGVARQMLFRCVVVLLLLLLFARALESAVHTSATYDEYIYIARGYTYLKTGDTRLKLRHPILVDVLATLPLLLEPDIQLPLDTVGWKEGDFHRYAPAFMWRANVHLADKILFLSRLPIMFLSLILGAAVFRWAHARSGLQAGLLALALYSFDPNILAHGRLVTPDIGQTTFIFLSAFAWYRYLAQPDGIRCCVAGLSLGLALTAGFPALILPPIFLLAAGIQSLLRPGARSIWDALWVWGRGVLLGAFVVWGIYAFDWGLVQDIGLSLPAPYYWEEFLDLLKRLNRQDLTYFMGEVYRGGRPAFFIVSLLMKTPITTLLLFSLGSLVLFSRMCKEKRQLWGYGLVLWLTPLLYYGNALRSNLNIGYRHILPILPFLFVIAGGSWHLVQRRWRKFVLGGLLAWLVASSLCIHPFYLAYFNEFAGGPLHGSRYLVVSDLDWGQDLPGLRAYLTAQGVDAPIYLSWFGTTPPEYYDIAYYPLPAWPPPDYPERVRFHPQYPLPGLYAISVANLVGARLPDPDTFQWFQQHSYETHIGYSIFIYRVPPLLDPQAPPVNIALSGTSLDVLPASIIEKYFQTNRLFPRWFDARMAMVFPQGRAFIVIGENTNVHPALYDRFLKNIDAAVPYVSTPGTQAVLYPVAQTQAVSSYVENVAEQVVFNSPTLVPQRAHPEIIQLPVLFDETLALLGYEILREGQVQADYIELLSVWRVIQQPGDLQAAIFAHLLSPEGAILGQDDRLDVVLLGLAPGDTFVQLHRIPVPDRLPEGPAWLQLGVYRRDTLERLSISADTQIDLGDRVLLQNIAR